MTGTRLPHKNLDEKLQVPITKHISSSDVETERSQTHQMSTLLTKKLTLDIQLNFYQNTQNKNT